MRQNLFTIPPDAPFLDTLAARVLDGTLLGNWPRQGPFWLTDVTILLPTRRAELALAAAFLKRGISLLPDIRALGEEDEAAQAFLPPLDAPPIPPAVSALERRLTLARLIAAWAARPAAAGGFATPPGAAEIFRLADSLGTLVDDLSTEGRRAADLRTIAPENLADNWQRSLEFLDIALEAWPTILAERGRTDGATRRNEQLRRQAEAAPLFFGDRPVIAAGSTGSIPATTGLLRAIARLARGAVVLPGLDTSLGESDLTALADPAEASHGHSQYGLVKLLNAVGARPDAVAEIADAGPRPRVVRRALSLAEATARWFDERRALDPDVGPALDGLAILAAPGEDMEARAIAIAARAALAQGRSVGIVSPDRNLARRIAAELARYDIEVDDTAGTPLFQSPAGRLGRALLSVAAEHYAPVPLMALLQNRATTLGLGRAEVSRLAQLLELGLLRGQRPAPGLDGLRQALSDNLGRRGTARPARRLFPDDGEAVGRLLDRLEAVLRPLAELVAKPAVDAHALAAALAEVVAATLATADDEEEPLLPGREEFTRWAESVAGAPVGPSFPPIALDAVLAALMAGVDVRPKRPGRTDIAIWGRLEARLQHADLMILAGLNEDVWPEPADPGPWLSRGMRLAAGLEPPERRQGQAAHDFEMALGGGEAILAYAVRRGSSPALPSPFLQRLEAFVGEGHARGLRRRGDVWVDMARRLDRAPRLAPATRPAPNPPVARRPRQLSVTEIETLFRSPYDVYARHVLGLTAMKPLGEDPDARDRGSIVHDIFARFVTEGHDFEAPDALQRLKQMAVEGFASLESIGERRDIWLRRFDRAAELFLAFERERQSRVAARHAEVKGEWSFPLLDGFRLTGRADRIDELAGGGLEIIDFKTGGVPTPGDMRNFLAPQLPLEAQLAAVGGFEAEGVRRAEAAALTYVKIGLGPEAFVIRPYAFAEGSDAPKTAEAMWNRLQRLVDHFLLSERPLPAQLLPVPNKRYRGDYEHLARVDEWAVAEDEEPWSVVS